MKPKLKIALILSLLSAVLAMCIFMVSRELLTQKKSDNDFHQLAMMITTEKEPSEERPALSSGVDLSTDRIESEESVSGKDLSPLLELNPDFFGWLSIPGTAIDYPVMHTPNESQKYLRRDFYGEYSSSGTPFLDARCSADSDNLIIYGHNMAAGTMFAPLEGYFKAVFRGEHPTLEWDTADGHKAFTIFAVVNFKSYDEWYRFVTAEDEQEYTEQINYIKNKALYETGITPEYGQQLITLSTCYDSAHNGRLLVIAAEEK